MNPHNRHITQGLTHGRSAPGRWRDDGRSLRNWAVRLNVMRHVSAVTTWVTLVAMCLSPAGSASSVHRSAAPHQKNVAAQSHVAASTYVRCSCDRRIMEHGGERTEAFSESTLGCSSRQRPTQPDCPPDCWCHSGKSLPSLPVRTVRLEISVESVGQADTEARALVNAKLHQTEWFASERLTPLSAHSRCVSLCRLVL